MVGGTLAKCTVDVWQDSDWCLVVVIDTGIYAEHEEFEQRAIRASFVTVNAI